MAAAYRRYCLVTVGALTQRSTTVPDGGAAPRWGSAKEEGGEPEGETMVFELPLEDMKRVGEVEVVVMDEDRLSRDDHIGAALLRLQNAPWDRAAFELEEWLAIVDARKRPTGRVRVRCSWVRDRGTRPAAATATAAAVVATAGEALLARTGEGASLHMGNHLCGRHGGLYARAENPSGGGHPRDVEAGPGGGGDGAVQPPGTPVRDGGGGA